MATPIETNTTELQGLLALAQSLPSGPSGTKSITAPGTYDVTAYENASVDVTNYIQSLVNTLIGGSY